MRRLLVITALVHGFLKREVKRELRNCFLLFVIVQRLSTCVVFLLNRDNADLVSMNIQQKNKKTKCSHVTTLYAPSLILFSIQLVLDQARHPVLSHSAASLHHRDRVPRVEKVSLVDQVLLVDQLAPPSPGQVSLPRGIYRFLSHLPTTSASSSTTLSTAGSLVANGGVAASMALIAGFLAS